MLIKTDSPLWWERWTYFKIMEKPCCDGNVTGCLTNVKVNCLFAGSLGIASVLFTLIPLGWGQSFTLSSNHHSQYGTFCMQVMPWSKWQSLISIKHLEILDWSVCMLQSQQLWVCPQPIAIGPDSTRRFPAPKFPAFSCFCLWITLRYENIAYGTSRAWWQIQETLYYSLQNHCFMINVCKWAITGPTLCRANFCILYSTFFTEPIHKIRGLPLKADNLTRFVYFLLLPNGDMHGLDFKHHIQRDAKFTWVLYSGMQMSTGCCQHEMYRCESSQGIQ